MDRDGRGRPPSNGPGSFDLSKKSAAQLAVELAAQMARWRQARNKPDTLAHAAAPEAIARPVARLTASEQFVLSTDGGVATAIHIDRAQRAAAQAAKLTTNGAGPRAARQPGSFGEPFKSLLAEGPNLGAIGMGAQNVPDPSRPAPTPAFLLHLAGTAPSHPHKLDALSVFRDVARGVGGHAGEATAKAQRLGIAGWHALGPALRACFDQIRTHAYALAMAAQRAAVAASPVLKTAVESLLARGMASAHALGVAARHAARDRLAIAGAAAITVAVAVWLLTPPDEVALPEVARAPEVDRSPAIDARAIATAFETIERPSAPRAAEPRQPEPAHLRLGQNPQPAVFIPTLTPRLKPPIRNVQH